MSSNRSQEFNELKERIKKLLGFKFDRELANALQISKSNFSYYRGKGTMPWTKLTILLKEHGIDDSFLSEYKNQEFEDSSGELNNLLDENLQKRLETKDQLVQVLGDYNQHLKESLASKKKEIEVLQEQINDLILELESTKKKAQQDLFYTTNDTDNSAAFKILMSFFINNKGASVEDAMVELKNRRISLPEKDFNAIVSMAQGMADEYWEEE